MVNEKIKSVVKDFLTKNNLSTDENMETLLLEVDNIKTLRDNVDKLIFEVKKNIIRSNSHLLIDKIFKDDNEGVIEILKNTRDRILFFDFIESLDLLVTEFEKYYTNYKENSPELYQMRENFFLTDKSIHEIITEINLDNK
jgi:hypothetical protein